MTTVAPASSERHLRRLGWYSKIARALGRTRPFAWLGVHVMTALDRRLYRWTGGAVSMPGVGAHLPVLLLTTIGRRSVRARQTALLYMQDCDRLVVVGSNWGQRRHPAWTENLLDDPKATVQVRDRTFPVIAQLATAEQKAEVWQKLLDMWPAFQTYSERSGRDLRVFFLHPMTRAD